MIQVKWCWDYEAKHLGSYPATPPYTGHNKPVEIIALSALTEVVEGLKWESGRKKCANADELNIALGYRYAMEDLLAQLEAHTKGEIKQ